MHQPCAFLPLLPFAIIQAALNTERGKIMKRQEDEVLYIHHSTLSLALSLQPESHIFLHSGLVSSTITIKARLNLSTRNQCANRSYQQGSYPAAMEIPYLLLTFTSFLCHTPKVPFSPCVRSAYFCANFSWNSIRCQKT